MMVYVCVQNTIPFNFQCTATPFVGLQPSSSREGEHELLKRLCPRGVPNQPLLMDYDYDI